MGGVGGSVQLGGTLRPDLLWGGGATGWIGESGDNTEAVLLLAPMARLYPGGGRFSIQGGAGLGIAFVTQEHRHAGLGGFVGLGYDVRTAGRSSLMLFVQGVGVATDPGANRPGAQPNQGRGAGGAFVYGSWRRFSSRADRTGRERAPRKGRLSAGVPCSRALRARR